ncbi:MAG: peptidase S8 [Clostridiales bacterium]|nr:peptidase S8 [Clostridiales bacterium]
MFSKIDKKLINKIKVQSYNNLIDVIIYTENIKCCKNKLLKYLHSDIIEIPFLKCIGATISGSEIFNISKCEDVVYISSCPKVSSLIYRSKNFLNYDNLINKVPCTGGHSLVVIDTGVYPHIDFTLGKNRIVEFVDLINNFNECYDDNGHGTFVTGIVCGNSITNKYSGIDRNGKVIVIKALDKNGETTTIKILQAMQWILDNKIKYNIKIVCMSFGSFLQETNDPLVSAVDILWNNGIVVVTAGGNSGPKERTIMSPGASRKVITVGSLDNLEDGISVADFSSRGPVFTYYKPDLVVPGVDIISTSVFDNSKNFYTSMSGTSMSTPMVAGIVSLLFNYNENYTPDQIKYMLINSCVKITGDRNSEGYGYLDLSKIILL